MNADLSLEVTAPSLGCWRREKIQEEGSDMHVKHCLLASCTCTTKTKLKQRQNSHAMILFRQFGQT